MKTFVKAALLLAGLCSTGVVFAQRNSYDDRYDDRDNDRQMRREERREERRMDDRFDERREYQRRNEEDRRYDNRYEDRQDRGNRNENRYDQRDLSRAYDEGFEDGQRSVDVAERKERRENYKRFTFGLYGGANATRFAGEDVQGNALSGRLGYQLGFFMRGGGRVYGQIGLEYLTSSSNISTIGSGTATTGTGSTTAISVNSITSSVDQQYLHIPVLIGVKLAQSERGVSGVRLAVGAELATPLAINNSINENAPAAIQQSNLQPVTFNGLANIGFDAGPLFLGVTYHYGFQDILREPVQGIVNSQRRILSVNVGLKF
ncbi:outer membrane beta-barrel protein [Spirosoma montaniterrae]|uniref:Uncharacterized protein n=1 Tax=Spirosoma montaniterrae TaxID=1178516 RepID=A0A1P9WSE2_9BACT|nr:outer membrane beta-barrel protein [Spirosoma montaniterrae]AQG78282.1 hypothetical protein AWR27_02355 [Spirosoma montaniterrae]